MKPDGGPGMFTWPLKCVVNRSPTSPSCTLPRSVSKGFVEVIVFWWNVVAAFVTVLRMDCCRNAATSTGVPSA